MFDSVSEELEIFFVHTRARATHCYSKQRSLYPTHALNVSSVNKPQYCSSSSQQFLTMGKGSSDLQSLELYCGNTNLYCFGSDCKLPFSPFSWRDNGLQKAAWNSTTVLYNMSWWSSYTSHYLSLRLVKATPSREMDGRAFALPHIYSNHLPLATRIGIETTGTPY